MKRIVAAIAVAVLITPGFAQEGWRIGISSGMLMNHSVYSGGMTDANALFTNRPHGGIVFGSVARHFCTKHWSVQTGISHTQMGFDFALARDYSLLKPASHFVNCASTISVTQVPLTAIYAFNPTCQDNRLFVGAGINLLAHHGKVDKVVDAVSTEKAPIPAGESLSQSVETNSFLTCTAQLMWGVEHLMKRGGIMQVAFVGNKGFTNLATATVNYTVNGQVYSHTFSNYGNYFSVNLNYYFRPFPRKFPK